MQTDVVDSGAVKPAAVYVAVASLRPWVKNPRKNDAAVSAVADSIKRFGFGAPLLARRDNGEIIAGHTRLKAALKMGLAEVPVRYLDLNESEAHALALADNKVGELADWDAGTLTGLLTEMRDSGSDMSGMGWTSDELASLLAEAPSDDDWSAGMNALPDQDRQPFQQMTFTLHDDQVEQIKRALEVAKGMGEFDSQNANGNGNALARVCESFLTTCADG